MCPGLIVLVQIPTWPWRMQTSAATRSKLNSEIGLGSTGSTGAFSKSILLCTILYM